MALTAADKTKHIPPRVETTTAVHQTFSRRSANYNPPYMRSARRGVLPVNTSHLQKTTY